MEIPRSSPASPRKTQSFMIFPPQIYIIFPYFVLGLLKCTDGPVLAFLKSTDGSVLALLQPIRIGPPLAASSSQAKFVKNQTFSCGTILHPLWDSEILKSLDIGLREVWAKRRLNGVNKEEEKICKIFFCCGSFWPFLSKNVHIWDHFFPLLWQNIFLGPVGFGKVG